MENQKPQKSKLLAFTTEYEPSHGVSSMDNARYSLKKGLKDMPVEVILRDIKDLQVPCSVRVSTEQLLIIDYNDIRWKNPVTGFALTLSAKELVRLIRSVWNLENGVDDGYLTKLRKRDFFTNLV